MAWRTEFEMLDQARRDLAGYVGDYHHRPHSRLDHRTPAEVAATYEEDQPDEPA